MSGFRARGFGLKRDINPILLAFPSNYLRSNPKQNFKNAPTRLLLTRKPVVPVQSLNIEVWIAVFACVVLPGLDYLHAPATWVIRAALISCPSFCSGEAISASICQLPIKELLRFSQQAPWEHTQGVTSFQRGERAGKLVTCNATWSLRPKCG
jgi:hypothetical protein